MDVELTKDEQEILLFIGMSKFRVTTKDIEKFTHVGDPKNARLSLQRKGMLRVYASSPLFTIFYGLTKKGEEAIEWI